MTKPEMITQNEELAIRKIRAAYQTQSVLRAMQLCQTFMGLDAREAYDTVNRLCGDLIVVLD